MLGLRKGFFYLSFDAVYEAMSIRDVEDMDSGA